jgi:hypothetical protein
MQLDTITMPRVEARKAYLELRAAIREQNARELERHRGTYRRERDAARERMREQDRAAARAYRHLSVGNQLLRLNSTVLSRFDDFFRPRLALARADVAEVRVTRWRGGTVRYVPEHDPWTQARSLHFEFNGPADERIDSQVVAVATTPSIPVEHRPEHKLSNYHLLWEAEWRARSTTAVAPRDPALLKHLGGDLWAVLAVWELTDVERAVLEGGRVL